MSRGKNKSPDERHYVFSLAFSIKIVVFIIQGRRFGSGEFLSFQHKIKRTHALKEGTQCLSTRTAPAQCDSAVITISGVSHRGEQSGGGETAMNVESFFKHFYRAEGSSFKIAMNATAPKQVTTTVVYVTKNAGISLVRRAPERP
jgi:hypothetical protein